MPHRILTANHLRDGGVVFLAADGGWVRSPEAATIAACADDERGLSTIAATAVADQTVVGPYLVDVTVTDGRPVPVRARERIRVSGPTVPADFRADAASA